MSVPRAYLDTCIISRVVDGRLQASDKAALSVLLALHRTAAVDLFTSTVAEAELRAIPDEYRDAHIDVYELFRSARKVSPSGLTCLGLSGVSTTNPNHRIWRRICEILDAMDAEHAFVAYRNRAQVLLTVDRTTILSRRERLESVSGLRAMTPAEYLRQIEGAAT